MTGTTVANQSRNTQSLDASDTMALKIMLVDDQPPRAAILPWLCFATPVTIRGARKS